MDNHVEVLERWSLEANSLLSVKCLNLICHVIKFATPTLNVPLSHFLGGHFFFYFQFMTFVLDVSFSL